MIVTALMGEPIGIDSSVSLLITSIIMTISAYPIKAIIYGFAQLVENSNVRTYNNDAKE